MAVFIVNLYRSLLPKEMRSRIYKLFLGDILFFFRNFKECLRCKWYLIYYFFRKPKNDQERAYLLLGKMGVSPYPYLWRKEYERIDYPSYIDTENGLPYVLHKRFCLCVT